jgi:hypothetical protein
MIDIFFRVYLLRSEFFNTVQYRIVLNVATATAVLLWIFKNDFLKIFTKFNKTNFSAQNCQLNINGKVKNSLLNDNKNLQLFRSIFEIV